MNSDRGAVQQKLDFLSEDAPTRLAELLRPESTDPALSDQPALSKSSRGDSGAELAPLRGTAVSGTRMCGGVGAGQGNPPSYPI